MTDRTTPQEASRAAFEAWAKPLFFSLIRLGEGYDNLITEAAWMAWKRRDEDCLALRDALENVKFDKSFVCLKERNQEAVRAALETK